MKACGDSEGTAVALLTSALDGGERPLLLAMQWVAVAVTVCTGVWKVLCFQVKPAWPYSKSGHTNCGIGP
jgi:hypothetical protein